MYPARFAYARPSSLDEAISLLQASGGEAKLLAGGHSLLPMMKLRLAEPATLIDIGRLKDTLAYVHARDGEVALGALATYHTLETSDELRRRLPVLAEAAAHVGDVQVRNRGTIGGSLAHGDPASDLPAALLAAEGSVTVRGAGGTREVPAGELFQDYLTTAVGPDELITEIRVPAMDGWGFSYQKFNRRAQDWAIVGVAAVRRNGSTGVALVNMGSTPVRATAVEEALASGAAAGEAAQQAADGTDPPADLNASVEFRQHLARVLTRRALEEAGL